MSGNQQIRQVSCKQLEALFEFLNEHREVAFEYNRTYKSQQHSKNMWARAADLLNSAGDGAVKTGPEWLKYWVDLKENLKWKNRSIKDACNRTGEGPLNMEELSVIETKFLTILGDDYGLGIPGVQVNPFPDGVPIAEPSSIKRESEELMLEEWLDMSCYEQQDTATRASSKSLPSVVRKPTPASTSDRKSSVKASPSSRTSSKPKESLHSSIPQPRRRQRRYLKAAHTRVQLVEAAKQRAASAAANTTMLKEAVCLLRELVSLIGTRYSVEKPRDEPQDLYEARARRGA